MGLLSHNSIRTNSVKRTPPRSVDAADRFKQSLDQVAADTESLLDRLLAPKTADGELSRPARLLDAMRYACLGGGKRVRPFLVVETARLFGVPRRQSLMVAAALECVHCYSLVHDDLPAMDDDALRRGRPTVHKAFDEATAILAGDGLLTFAFDILSRQQTHAKPDIRFNSFRASARRRNRRDGGRANARSRGRRPIYKWPAAPAWRQQRQNAASYENRRALEVRLRERSDSRRGSSKVDGGARTFRLGGRGSLSSRR